MKEFNVTGVCVSEKHYMVDISEKVKKIVGMVDKGEYFAINRPRQFGKTTTFKDLSKNITNLIEEYNNEVILIIDEVDKSSNNRVFMQFLGVLRNKYLSTAAKEDITFKSVVLGGVNEGYLLTFNFNKNKEYSAEWIDVNNKKIFEVIV